MFRIPLGFLAGCLLTTFTGEAGFTQSITAAPDGTGTVIDIQGNRYNIDGGTQAGANLFHSFQQFGLSSGAIANFLSHPNITNIFGRVVGGDPSFINGLIQATPNLYLMNPAGIVFGSGASLNVGGDFVATTATSIGFSRGWFDAIGTPDYTLLTSEPRQFAFDNNQPGAIASEADLSVGSGQTVGLIGGTVESQGQFSGGNLVISAVGRNVVRISQPGNLLSLEIGLSRSGAAPALRGLSGLDLPALLTGAQSEGISLTTTANPQEVVIQNDITGDAATVLAIENIRISASQIEVTGDLRLESWAQVIAQDSVTTPLLFRVGGDLDIEGTEGIEISALNHLPLNAIQSGGNTTLTSRDIISLDAHVDVGGDFRTRSSDLIRSRNAIFEVGNNFVINNYEGASLQVNAGGNIRFRNLSINAINPIVDPDHPAITFKSGGRIGTFSSDLSSDLPELVLDFQADEDILLNHAVTNGGPISLNSANGYVNVNELDSSSDTGSGGDIFISSFFGSSLDNVDSSSVFGDGGDLNLSGHTSFQRVNTSSQLGNGGNISSTDSFSVLFSIDTSSKNGDGGSISTPGRISTASSIPHTAIITSSELGNGGSISTGIPGLIGTGGIHSFSEINTSSRQGNGGDILAGRFLRADLVNTSSEFGNGGNISSESLSAETIITSSRYQQSGSIDVDYAYNIFASQADFGLIDTTSEFGNGGDVDLAATWILIRDGGIKTSGAIESGDIILDSVSGINAFSGTTGAVLDTSSATGNGGNVSVGVTSSPIGVSGGTLRVADINTSAKGNAGNINIGTGRQSIDATGGILNASGGENGGNVFLISPADISTGDIITFVSGFNGDSGDVTIQTTSYGDIDTSFGSIVTASGNGEGGDIILRSNNDLTTGAMFARSLSNTNAGGKIQLVSENVSGRGQFTLGGSIQTNRNDILIQAPNSGIQLQDNLTIRSAESGDIEIKGSLDGAVDLGIDAGQGTVRLSAAIGETTALNSVAVGGNITTTDPQGVRITATQNITTDNITTAEGITLTSANGAIRTRLLDTSSTTDAGDINLNAPGSIHTAALDSRSTNGQGGDVNATTIGFFTADSTISGTNDSISTVGSSDGGTIAIQHGGSGVVPFIVGDGTINGTAGRIVRDNANPLSSITPTARYFTTHTQDSDRIQIISVPGLGLDPFWTSPTPSPNTTPISTPIAIASGASTASSPVERLAVLVGDIIGATTNIEERNGQLEIVWEQNDNPILDLNVALPELDAVSVSPPDLTAFQQLDFLATNADLVADVDQLLEDDYEEFLGEELSDRSVTVQGIHEMLATIEQETGTRAVVLYAIHQGQSIQLILVHPEHELLTRNISLDSSDSFEQVAGSFRRAVQNTRSPTSYLQPAQQLYDWLIRPFESELAALEIDTLVFSLNAGLRTLPLAALHDGEQFLVEKYSLGQIPSVSLTNSDYQPLHQAQTLVMGASEFQTLAPLPAVPHEAAAIATLFNSEVHLNDAFTRKNLETQSRDRAFEIVHLATHAEFKGSHDADSYIQLWGDEQIPPQNLRDLRWYDAPQVELLVLSACVTAVGDRDAELGFAGLAVQAGVKSALASLWYVSDLGTFTLMSKFYQHLRDTDITIKAEALRQGQLALLRREVDLSAMPSLPFGLGVSGVNMSHPYYWSGFMMVGSPW